MVEEVFDVGGMHCAACSASVERVVKKLPGIESADVNLMFGTLSVKYDEKLTAQSDIIAKVEKAGFTAVIRTDGGSIRTGADYSLRQIILLACLSFCVLLISMADMLFPRMLSSFPEFLRPSENPLLYALTELALTLPVVIIGRRYYRDGFSSLFRGRPDMNSLVAMSSAASFVYSLVMTAVTAVKPGTYPLYYESAAMVITLVSVGKYLENGAKNKTKDAIGKLISLSPESANRVSDNGDGSFGEPENVPSAELYTGDIILVRQGERVPADAEVVAGSAGADESALTGESLPVKKSRGDKIICGSLISEGFVYASVENVGSGTVIAGIVRFVTDAQKKKAPISRLADKVAGVFVPAVFAIAATASAVWLIAGKDIAFAMRIFTSVLVIACPCAMGLATPTAIMSGTGLGARSGILVRSGEALEKLAGIDTAVFDKTGTVTTGIIKVEYTETVQDPDYYSESELLAAAASLERMSVHPYAAAVVAEAANRGLSLCGAADFTSVAGEGITGTLSDGRRVTAGSRKMAADSCTDTEVIPPDGVPGAIYVSVDGVYEGRIVLSDSLRTEAPDTVKRLAEMGISSVMLTGDRRAAAEEIAAKAGIVSVIPGVRPEGKAGHVEQMRKEGKRVAMIGDGINDAPALTVADVGIAVGNGTDIAVDAADAVLMGEGISAVPAAIRLGRLTIRNIKQNLFWAFCYNVLAIPVACGALYPAFGILLTPMIGCICMSLSSLFVVTNALRLGSVKLK